MKSSEKTFSTDLIPGEILWASGKFGRILYSTKPVKSIGFRNRGNLVGEGAITVKTEGVIIQDRTILIGDIMDFQIKNIHTDTIAFVEITIGYTEALGYAVIANYGESSWQIENDETINFFKALCQITNKPDKLSELDEAEIKAKESLHVAILPIIVFYLLGVLPGLIVTAAITWRMSMTDPSKMKWFYFTVACAAFYVLIIFWILVNF
ncbi:MAG: hypothetical protein ACFFD4_00135 [Candidatus Odinarchaeota archaeon]